ncbi:hypothetical protein KI387_004014, partial [Taxus chinensis]
KEESPTREESPEKEESPVKKKQRVAQGLDSEKTKNIKDDDSEEENEGDNVKCEEAQNPP